jgi:hypothetical protein
VQWDTHKTDGTNRGLGMYCGQYSKEYTIRIVKVKEFYVAIHSIWSGRPVKRKPYVGARLNFYIVAYVVGVAVVLGYMS